MLKANIFRVKLLCVSCLLFFITAFVVSAQSNFDVLRRPGGNTPGPQWLSFTDAGNSLYHYLSRQAFELLESRVKITADLNSLEDWQKRQETIKQALMDIVGPFPQKTPLNPKILKTVKKDGFKVEQLVFESQPGFYVTASLFIPEGLKRGSKVPAVLYCSGHTDIAYRSTNETYQVLILNLVKKGFVVLAFDPVGQGERLQYFNAETGKSDIGASTAEHSYCGIQAFITGSSLAKYMIYDGIRAVDYLLTRKEVDPSRIAITGCSGGGTQTSYIAAFDDRIKVAIPQCYITNLTRLLQSLGPQDAEQNLFHGIKRQIDHADYLIVRAPKPTLVLATTEDFFNIHGTRETVREVEKIFKAYGMEENFGMAEDAGLHGTTRKNREVMYAFLQKHFNYPGNPVEENVEFLSMEEMKITELGQISTTFGGETVFSLNKKDVEECMIKLENSRKNMQEHLPIALKKAERLSGYISPGPISEPVLTGCIYKEKYLIEKFYTQGEGDYVIPFILLKPVRSNNKAIIYIHPDGKAAEAHDGGEIEYFLDQGFTVLAPDLPGVGELGIGSRVNSVWFTSVLIGRSIVAIQAADINRLADVLQKYMFINEIYGLARKEMSPALLHAAAFNKRISRIALIEPYSSYRSVVMNRFYDQRFVSGAVAASLTAYDLPDLAASLAPRKLAMIGITDGNSERKDRGVNEELLIIKNYYQQNNASNKLQILMEEPSKSIMTKLLTDWLN